MAQGYDLRITVTGEDKASGPIGGIKGALGGLSSAFSGLASVATFGAGAAVAGLVGIGAAGVAAWGDYDAALDTVMQKTGLTGSALDDMGGRIRDLSTGTAGVGTDMAHIGEVMADLQVRTGATGDTLQGLSQNLLQLQQVQGDSAVSAANFGRLLGDWGVPAENGSKLMDQLFTASQKFGVGTDNLAGKLVQFGSPLRQMGFDLNTSIALFGQFEQQGVNTELVLGSLRIAAGKFADAGVPLKQGLSDSITKIHDMEDSSKALALAMDIFGARAGPDMAAAIREGKFSLDDAVASIQGYEGSIQQAAEGAMDFPDQWAMGMNQIKAALVPVGQAVMDLGSAAMPILKQGFDMVAGAATSFASGLSIVTDMVSGVLYNLNGGEIFDPIQEGLLGLGVAQPVADAVARSLSQLIGIVVEVGSYFADASMPVETLRDNLTTVVSPETADTLAYLAGRAWDLGTALSSLASGDFSGFAGSLAMAFGMGEDAANDLIGTLDSLSAVFPSLADGVTPLDALKEAFFSGAITADQLQAAASPLGQSLLGVASVVAVLSSIGMTLASIVGGVLSSAFQTAGQVASVVMAGLPALIQAVQGPISTIASLVGSVLISAFANAGSIIQSVLGVLPGLVQIGMGVLTSLAGTVSSIVAGAFQILAPIAQSVFAGIVTVVQMALPPLMNLASAVGSLLVAAFNVLRDIAISVFTAILPYIPTIQAYIAALAVIVGSVLGAAFNWLAGVIRGTVIPAIQTAGAWLAQNLPGAIQVVMNFITGTLLPGLLNLANWLAQNLPGAIQALSGFWTGVLQPAIATVWGFISGTLFPLFLQLVGWLQTNIPQALAALSGFWQEHKDQIISIAQTAWDLIKGAIDGVLKTISTLWSAFQSAREGDWRDFGAKLRTIWDDAWQAIKNAITTIGPEIVSALGTLATNAKNKFLEVDWKQLGVDIIQGIGNGVTSMGGWLAGLARDAASKMLDAAKGFLGIQSPSKVMADEVGLPMAQGLAAGFAGGLDGSALVSIVAGIRAVMEQIAQILKGVGDKVSTSDWEDLSGPVKLMADTFKAISDIGATLAQEGMAANWEAARQQAGAMIASARQIMVDLASTVKGVGDRVSTSDWEDFAGPLKLLADSLSSIASVSALFADEKNIPSLAGLGGTIRQLAVDARALLVDLDSAIQPISSGLPDKLKTLGDAAAGARSVADGALGLVKSLQEALTVNWGAINWPDAGRMMADLAGMVRWFASKAEEASKDIAKIDTSGLGPLKAAAENLIGIADGARALVTRLVDGLKVDWGAVKWSDAGRMMADLSRMVIYFSEKALTYAGALKDLDLGPLAQMKTAADSLLGIVEGARSTTLALVDALKVDWGAVRWSDAGRLMADMGRMVVFFAERALTYAAALKDLDTGALSQLKSAAEAVQGAASAAWSLVQFALDTLKFDWSKVRLSDLTGNITRLILAGQQLAQAARDAMGAWSIEAMPALTGLGAVLQDSLSVVQTVFDLIDRVVHGGLPSGILATSRWDSTSPLQDALWRVVLAAQQIGQAVHDALGTWTVTVPPGLANLKTVLSDSLGIFEDTYKAIDLIMGGANPSSLGAAFTPDSRDAYNRSPIHRRIDELVVFARNLADMIAGAMGTWTVTVPPGLVNLKAVLADSIGIIQDTYAAVGLVMGEGYGGINPADFTPDQNDRYNRSPIWQRIANLIVYATNLADMIRLSIGSWNMTVPPGLTTLKTVLSDSLGLIKDTFGVVDLLMGKDAPDLSGANFVAGENNPVAQRLRTVLLAAQSIATAAAEVMGEWDIKVKDSLTRLGTVLKGSLEAATTTLDLNALLGGKTAPTFDIAVLKTRLASALQAGKDLADEANRVLAEWDIKVKDSLSRLGTVLKGSLDVAGSVLDFSDLQARLLSFRGFDMRLLGPKIDLLISSAIAVAQEFGTKAENAQIKEEWQKAGAALKGLFGDAASTISDALDMGSQLLDPQTQIPSLGQIQGKLDALFALITGVATQYAAKASSLAASGIDTQAAGELAGQVKDIFDSLSQVAQTVQDFTGIAIGSSGFNNIQALLDNVFGLFANVAGQAGIANEVSAALASLLGGLQNLASTSGFSAGQSWASQFAAGINDGLSGATEEAARALTRLTGGGGTGNGNVTITTNTYHNTYNNTLNLNVDAANAEAVTLNFSLLEAMSGA